MLYKDLKCQISKLTLIDTPPDEKFDLDVLDFQPKNISFFVGEDYEDNANIVNKYILKYP